MQIVYIGISVKIEVIQIFKLIIDLFIGNKPEHNIVSSNWYLLCCKN